MIVALMNEKYWCGESFADHEIAQIMIAVLMVGHDTSSSSVSWALLEASDQEQVKCFGINGQPGRFNPLTYEDLPKPAMLDFVNRGTVCVHVSMDSIICAVGYDVLTPSTLAAAFSKSGDGTWIPEHGKNASGRELRRWNDPEGVVMSVLKEYTDENGEYVAVGLRAVSKGADSTYAPFGVSFVQSMRLIFNLAAGLIYVHNVTPTVGCGSVTSNSVSSTFSLVRDFTNAVLNKARYWRWLAERREYEINYMNDEWAAAALKSDGTSKISSIGRG
ncbi:uncharacterized protein C8R40DRAFT_1074068 [Lentinula edodes]|uniref:uncharacterized protein n=1 Tax=Lentinula edodes TaxID=5353 RepID=UPI001E8EA4B2|nr:uncharacterized protein C8R40DRAFT_1074068 [Lentinula edodes]KAH7869391.1 hypothetical protein C8R40DRAFT_1074068 [Lentinula edodes]